MPEAHSNDSTSTGQIRCEEERPKKRKDRASHSGFCLHCPCFPCFLSFSFITCLVRMFCIACSLHFSCHSDFDDVPDFPYSFRCLPMRILHLRSVPFRIFHPNGPYRTTELPACRSGRLLHSIHDTHCLTIVDSSYPHRRINRFPQSRRFLAHTEPFDKDRREVQAGAVLVSQSNQYRQHSLHGLALLSLREKALHQPGFPSPPQSGKHGVRIRGNTLPSNSS